MSSGYSGRVKERNRAAQEQSRKSGAVSSALLAAVGEIQRSGRLRASLRGIAEAQNSSERQHGQSQQPAGAGAGRAQDNMCPGGL